MEAARKKERMSVEVRVETLNTETKTAKGSELADVME